MNSFRLLLWALSYTAITCSAADSDWAGSVKLPASEKPIRLFNSKDFTGWEGQIEKYWSVENGAIKAANKDTVPVSTYLFTKQSFRNFRLLFEVKQTRGPEFSTMHSALAVLGEKFNDKGDPFSFKGPLVMFCNDWGIWDANRRDRVFPAGHQGTLATTAEKVGDWNRIELLVTGNRLRKVVNGELIMDFTDKPEMLNPSPIGLQLHSNSKPQEYRFRGLLLSENPEDRLVTQTRQ